MAGLGWVLVTDGTSGQNRSALAAVRALGAAGYNAAVTVSGPGPSIAAASRFCGRVVRVPPADDPGYADAVRSEAAAHDYLTVLPASDAGMQALQAPGRHLLDKYRLEALAREAGFQVPHGRPFEHFECLRAAADELDYPCVVKPTLRTGSQHVSARRFESAEHLRQAPHMPGLLLVQRVVDAGMHSVGGVMWKGRLVSAVHQRHDRLWPPLAGDACYAVTTAPDPSLEEKLERLLVGYDGVFQAEFAGPCLLDVNPRVYGSLPLAVAAGINPVSVYCDLIRGIDVPPSRARPGVRYHWWEGDLRHVASRWQSGELTIRHGVRALGIGSALNRYRPVLRDPKPSLSRTWYAGRGLGRRLAGSFSSRRPEGSGADADRPSERTGG